jgi:hypothetical protein
MGCKKFGFKCRTVPSLEVLAATGKQCVFFETKPDFSATNPRRVAVLPDNCSFSIVG